VSHLNKALDTSSSSPISDRSSHVLHTLRYLQLVAMANSSDRMVPVDLSATVICRGRDGFTSPIVFKKEFMLPARVIKRGKTDRNYRGNVIQAMIRRSFAEMMSLKPSWHCFSCQGNVHRFGSIPTGLTKPDENGRVPCRLFLVPVCGDGGCSTSSMQEFNSILERPLKTPEPSEPPTQIVAFKFVEWATKVMTRRIDSTNAAAAK
jgi:hypothetical protein